MTPVFFALDLARIARQHPALAQRRPQRLGRGDQRARNSVTDRVGLRRRPAAAHAHDDIVKELRRHSADGGPLPARRIADQIPTVQPEPTRSDRDEGPHGSKE